MDYNEEDFIYNEETGEYVLERDIIHGLKEAEWDELRHYEEELLNKTTLNIYLILVPVFDWDEYDSAVVIAENKKEAIDIAVKHCANFKKYELNISIIGVAIKDEQKRIVLASFNAG